jgi:hypothetical protein
MFQRVAIEKFHGNECARIMLADVVNGADVGMIQRGSGLRFALESRQCLRVFGNFIGQKFQGDKTLEACVFRFVDHTHSAAPQFFQDAIVRNSLSEQRLGIRHLECNPED